MSTDTFDREAARKEAENARDHGFGSEIGLGEMLVAALAALTTAEQRAEAAERERDEAREEANHQQAAIDRLQRDHEQWRVASERRRIGRVEALEKIRQEQGERINALAQSLTGDSSALVVDFKRDTDSLQGQVADLRADLRRAGDERDTARAHLAEVQAQRDALREVEKAARRVLDEPIIDYFDNIRASYSAALDALESALAKVPAPTTESGTEEGMTCYRDGCEGVIKFLDPKNCSCHLGGAPCSACEDASRLTCTECGWRKGDGQ